MKLTYINVIKILCLSGCITFYSIFMFHYLISKSYIKIGPAPYPISQLPRINVQVGKGLYYANADVYITPAVKNYVLDKQSLDFRKKIDWHNYTFMKYEKGRKGRGEQGIPDHLRPNEMGNYEHLRSQNGFNAALSDKISLSRAVPDIRHLLCHTKNYLKHLGKVSVIIPFHNEHWTTLLRNVHSIVNRSPAKLLKEIILVNDKSTKNFSKGPLDKYMNKNMPKVKIVHLPERRGLIGARLAGAKAATGDVIVILDSHCEVNVNWLPPLLEPIAMDYKTCVCPFVDVIAHDTFEYRTQDEGARGAFNWGFDYKRLPLRPEDLLRPAEPFKSPVMAGGLFAISRKFFWELGGYDEGLQIWGGEQYELSFKIWMCGGQMLDAPCSRVGHIYRHDAPTFANNAEQNFLQKNYKRVAEVWMDEYAEHLYRRNSVLKQIDPGNITELKALRKRLKCKSFDWYMKNVAYDLMDSYPPIEPKLFAFGKINSMYAPDLCISVDQIVKVEQCIENISEFEFTWRNEIKIRDKGLCWDFPDQMIGNIVLYECHQGGGNQCFRYCHEKKTIQFGRSDDNNCVDYDHVSHKVFIRPCNSSSETQKWNFENVNEQEIKNWRLHYQLK